MNYYEHHLGDYARDAGHLSMIEDGAYRRLMEVCYSSEQPLPNDIKEVCKLARANTKPEKDAVRYVLGKFFRLTDAGYTQKRCQEEIERYRKKVEAASAAGKASAESKQRKATTVQRPFNDRSTTVQRPLPIRYNENPTLQTPYTSNQTPESNTQNSERASDGAFLDGCDPFDHESPPEPPPKPTVTPPSMTEAEHQEAFLRVQAALPKFYGQQPGLKLELACRNLVNHGATWEQLEDGAKRYAAFIEATEQIVMNPLKFFTAENEPWRQEWVIPPGKAEKRLTANLASAQRFLANTDTDEDIDYTRRTS